MIGEVIGEIDLEAADVADAPGIERLLKPDMMAVKDWGLVESLSHEVLKVAFLPFQAAMRVRLVFDNANFKH